MLKFNLLEVKPILEHATQATSHKKTYGQEGVAKAGLWLVKDEGVYLMSNGDPAQQSPVAGLPNATPLRVCYAIGHNPRFNNTWESDRDECGGDDFVQFIDADIVQRGIAAGFRYLKIKMDTRTFAISFSMQ